MNEINEMGKTEKASSGIRIVLMTIGWISALLSLWMYAFIFGGIGVVMGILATKNGSRAGVSLIVASIILMGIGMIFSGVIMNYTRHFLGM